MHIHTLVLGDFETNCYILKPTPDADRCLVIDPGFDPQGLLDFLRDNKLTIESILLTHGHCDHIAGVPLLREKLGPIPIAISPHDADMLNSGRANLAWLTGRRLKVGPPDQLLQPGQAIDFQDIHLEIRPTPGHTPGGISLYDPNAAVVFTGDALFAGSIGRHDFPGGNLETLLTAIRQQLLSLPDDTTVYPGHGPATNIAQEKNHNPFFT